MADVNNSYNNYVRFVLKSTFKDSIIIKEPIGWKDDDLELDRHKDYHGIFTNFTNNLEFTNEAKQYINDAYEIYGINEDLLLIKQITKDDGTDVVWQTRYTAYADFNTLVNEETTLSIKFNSNNLAELIKSHESDDFEIETDKDIDGNGIGTIETNSVEIKGRDISQVGESILKKDLADFTFNYSGLGFNFFNGFNNLFVGLEFTVLTDIVSRGSDRHSSVDVWIVGDENEKASNMFYVDQTGTYDANLEGLDVELQFDLDFDLKGNVSISFERFKWNDTLGKWEANGSHPLGDYEGDYVNSTNFTLNETNTFLDVGFDEGLMLVFKSNYVYGFPTSTIKINKHTLKVNEKTRYESSPNLDFLFNHDLSNRLLYIISGNANSYYSKYFGNTNMLDSNGNQIYVQDGEGGLIGVMSGLWARAFVRDTDKYKSLTISLKDNLNSNHSVFNTGIGIETVNFKERVREEDLRYFYQNEVAVRLPLQITKVKRTVDKSLFFSGMSFGYDKAGDYEDSMGLDEPNTRTDYVTPIRKTINKFIKTSKIRTDEYGLELARRKPQQLFGDEDTRYDDGNWYLDLKRVDGALGFEQNDYTDRLQELPTGINSPTTYRSMYFTPLRMLFRHAWVFRGGMEKYLSKVIKYISAVSNSQLTTWTIGDTKPYAENDDISLRDLDRSRFLPEIVEFEHPVDDDLMDLINGKTSIEYGGEVEDIPNVYFKFEYTNENGILERGYLLNLKPNKEGKWKMQLSNENIIT